MSCIVNRVLEMGRYIKKEPKVTVSQEVFGTISALMVMVGIWGLLVQTIKGIKKLSNAASAKIKTVKNEKTAKKMQKELERTETLTTALERVSERLNKTEVFAHTVTVEVSRLGGDDYKSIQQHLGKNILAPLEMLLRKTESQLLKVYDKNLYLENDGADEDIHENIEPLASALNDILVTFFKNKPFNQNGLYFKTVESDHYTSKLTIRYDFEVTKKEDAVTLSSHDDAANLLVLAGKLLELHLKFLAIPTSNYAQNETYWLWDVQNMLGYTVRDIINLVAKTLNERETQSIEGK
jgi:hypothetical protein